MSIYSFRIGLYVGMYAGPWWTIGKQFAIINKQTPLISPRSSLPSLTLFKVSSSSPSTVQCAERWVRLVVPLPLSRHEDILRSCVSNSAPYSDLCGCRSLRQVGFMLANVTLVSGAVWSHGRTVDQTWEGLVWHSCPYVAALLLYNAAW